MAQIVTFSYNQNATSQSFNKLLYKLLPKGIISGGELSLDTTDSSGKTIIVAPFVCLYESSNTTIRIENTESVKVTSSVSKPYIVGKYDWQNAKDNALKIECASRDEIFSSTTEKKSDISYLIFGKLTFNNDQTINTYNDYTQKDWSTLHYELNEDLPFRLVLNDANNIITVAQSSGIINGKRVTMKSDLSIDNIFTLLATELNVSDFPTTHNELKFILSLIPSSDDAGVSAKIIHNDEWTEPSLPSSSYPIAYITIKENAQIIEGGNIEYIYNKGIQYNNGIDLSMTDGELTYTDSNGTKKSLLTTTYGVGGYVDSLNICGIVYVDPSACGGGAMNVIMSCSTYYFYCSGYYPSLDLYVPSECISDGNPYSIVSCNDDYKKYHGCANDDNTICTSHCKNVLYKINATLDSTMPMPSSCLC